MVRVRLSLPALVAVIAALSVAAVGAIIASSSGSGAVSSVPKPDHTVIVVLENKAYTQVLPTPYYSSLVTQGANMTLSHGVTHPSEPNYLALWSGSTQGLTDDSCPHTYSGSLGEQLLSAGLTVSGYSESMPSAGYTGCSSGRYVRKHNPLADFGATAGPAHNQTFAAFPRDYSTLPDVSLVVPNQCNNSHDCPVTTADNWLWNNIDSYAQWAKTHNSLLIVTFDENDGRAGNQIATVVVGQHVRPGNYGDNINHYNILHTIEAAYGLPLLGAPAAPITSIWTSSTTPSTPSTTVGSPVTSTPAAPSTPVAPSTPSTPSSPAAPSSPAGAGGTPLTSAGGTAPLRGAFYYPWFPNAWDQGGQVPYTHYSVSSGQYSSTDPSQIRSQIAAMQYAHLDFAIDSWWGQGSQPDSAVAADLAAANGTGFRWSLYYEAEGNSDPSVAQISSDLAYIAARYASNPNYLTIGGKPVIFVYGDSGDDCAMATRWAQADPGHRFYIDLKVFNGYRTCAAQPSAWHQYGPASAADSQAGQSYTISPGFFKANETTPRLVRDRSRWQSDIRAMVASKAPMQLVTTFNEWGEGTAVENAAQWAGGPYGTYLQDLHDLIPASGTAVNVPSITIVPATTYAYSAGSRVGAATYINGLVKQQDPTTGVISRSGGRLAYLQRYIGGTWQTMIARPVLGDGTLAVGFMQPVPMSYRWVVIATPAARGAASAPTTH